MATVDDRPFPPGEYPVVVVGSGPGGLQISYTLTRLGIGHAVISDDEGPGGMFRRFPLFDRLVSWTKLHAPAPPGSRTHEWYDWNSLLADDASDWVGVGEFMDGTSIFPARGEMERALVAFAERNAVRVRYGCRWRATSRTDSGFVLETSDGEYRCRVAIFAVGVAEGWRPRDIPGIEDVPHYMDLKKRHDYTGKSLYVVGKGVSAFEIASGLLPQVRGVVLASPHHVRLSVVERSFGGLRACYMQPLEDHALEGRTIEVLDASTERLERTDSGYRVHLRGSTRPWQRTFEVDEVIAATGVSAPLVDLPDLGVQTIQRGGVLPAQTPFWESQSVPGIYFAGSATQASFGLRSYGVGAVHGSRYNARVLGAHIGERHFGIERTRRRLAPAEVVPFLLEEATHAPELWHQRSVLGRVVTLDPGTGPLDEGIVPVTHFVDEAGPPGVAAAVLAEDDGELHPVFYVRRAGGVEEHILETSPELDFRTDEHRRSLAALIRDL